MGDMSPKIEAYISKSAVFSRPILEKLRQLFHQACPQIQETIKWGTPHFEHQGIVGSMAAFKKHVSFGFWKGKQRPKTRAKPKRKARELEVPDYFLTALKKNKKALAAFEGFSYSHRKEYIEWLTEAKRSETREKRLQTAVEWLAEGKPRNWKYMQGRV